MRSTFLATIVLGCALAFGGTAAAEPKVNQPKTPTELKQAEDKLKASQNKRSKREVNQGVRKLETAGKDFGGKLDSSLNGGGSKKKATKKKAPKKRR